MTSFTPSLLRHEGVWVVHTLLLERLGRTLLLRSVVCLKSSLVACMLLLRRWTVRSSLRHVGPLMITIRVPIVSKTDIAVEPEWIWDSSLLSSRWWVQRC